MRKQKSGDLQSPRRMIESDHGTTRDCRIKTTSQSSLRKRKEAESFHILFIGNTSNKHKKKEAARLLSDALSACTVRRFSEKHLSVSITPSLHLFIMH